MEPFFYSPCVFFTANGTIRRITLMHWLSTWNICCSQLRLPWSCHGNTGPLFRSVKGQSMQGALVTLPWVGVSTIPPAARLLPVLKAFFFEGCRSFIKSLFSILNLTLLILLLNSSWKYLRICFDGFRIFKVWIQLYNLSVESKLAIKDHHESIRDSFNTHCGGIKQEYAKEWVDFGYFPLLVLCLGLLHIDPYQYKISM